MSEPVESVRERVIRKLQAELSPTHLEVVDESALHAGHASKPPGDETHFRVHIVSPLFEKRSLLARHRLVYTVLASEIQQHIHALSLTAQTPAEMQREAPS